MPRDDMKSLHKVQDQLRRFKRKFATSLEDFSDKLKTRDQEDFEAWDDYMEWKAYRRLFDELTQ